nr:ABC transporter permease [Pseudomarimonas arenosa]
MSLRRFVDIVTFKSYADLRAERERTYLGFMWWVFEPLMFMVVLWVVFAKVLGRATEDFLPFILVGLVMWQWIKSCISHGSNAILEAHQLILQVRLPPVVFPLVTILSDTVKFAIVLGILIAILLVLGYGRSPALLALPLVLIAELAFLAAVTLWLAAFVPFVPDLRFVAENVLVAMMFLSGIFYDATTLAPAIQEVFFLNPSAFLIKEAREVLLYSRWPDFVGLIEVTVVCTLLAVAAAALIQRLHRYYPKLPR